MALRPIEPLPFPEQTIPDLGPRPELIWVPPTSLVVDETYQRDLKANSFRLIGKMLKEFRWNRMKPPIVVRVEEGMHVIDGQHTAIVAATLKLPEIPVFVVSADGIDDRARAFVGHNTDRVVVQPIEIFRALVAAGDAEALEVQAVMDRAKVRLRIISPTAALAEGDTMAIATIRNLVKTRGPMLARQVLEALVRAKRAPISAPEIHAAEMLLCVGEKRPSQEELTMAVRAAGDAGLMAAQAHARMIKKPVWRVLADRWRESIEQKSAA